MARTYDFVAIGGGSAGFNAARVAAALGKRTAVIDGARKLGGLCILRGCMPSKTLIYSAEVLHLARSGATFGLRMGGASADMKAIHARKDRIIAEFARDRERQLKSGDFDLIREQARFVDRQHRRAPEREKDHGEAFPHRDGLQGERPAGARACRVPLLDERRRP